MIVEMQQGRKNCLGRLGENEARTARFLVRDVLYEHPNAEFTILNRRPEDPAAYPVPSANVQMDGTYLLWTLTSGDLTKKGDGVCELVATENGAICKSVYYDTEILDALDGSGTVPEPWTGWVAQVTDAADRADAAADLLRNCSAESETLEPGSQATANYSDGTFSFGIPKGEKGDQGDPGQDGQDGQPGADGYSPTATVEKSGSTATITITDKNGTTTAQVSDGSALIDDTAGAGDTDKAWSADKLVSAIPDISGKADKVSGATNNNFAALDANGNLKDSGKKASDFSTTDTLDAARVQAVTTVALPNNTVQIIIVALFTDYILRTNNVFPVVFKQNYTIGQSGRAGNITMGVNGTTSKSVYLDGASSISGAVTINAGVYWAYYDGTRYYLRTDGLSAPKLNGFTLEKSVPSNAVFTDTTYAVATQSADGLMSASDKTKLDGLVVASTTETQAIIDEYSGVSA